MGRSLRGGEERVEEVRVGLLGVLREVEGLAEKVRERGGAVGGLAEERRRVRGQVVFGRGLLELERRVGGLEGGLGVKGVVEGEANGDGAGEGEEARGEDDGFVEEGEGLDDGDDDEEEDEEDDDDMVLMKRLRRRMEQFVIIQRLAERLGEEHPFVAAREERRERLRKTLLLDMGNAMKRAVETDGETGEKELYMLKTYDLMGEPGECMTVLKQAKAGLRKEKGKKR